MRARVAGCRRGVAGWPARVAGAVRAGCGRGAVGDVRQRHHAPGASRAKYEELHRRTTEGRPVADSPDDSSPDRDPGGTPPPGVDVSVPHPARVRNFWLGGHEFFKADRIAGEQLAQEYPHLPELARAERAFLVRAMRFLAGPARIRQFLDIGSGLPAGGNTHEIAQRIVPDTGIVYVDNDPGVLAHAKVLLDQLPASGGTVLGGAALGGAGAVLGEAAV